MAAAPPRRRSSRSRASGWPTSRPRAGSPSPASCRRPRPARSRSTCCARARPTSPASRPARGAAGADGGLPAEGFGEVLVFEQFGRVEPELHLVLRFLPVTGGVHEVGDGVAGGGGDGLGLVREVAADRAGLGLVR